jgi:hypothetical protein
MLLILECQHSLEVSSLQAICSTKAQNIPNQDLDFQCHMSWFLFVFSDLRREVIVRFVDSGVIIDQHF